MLTDLPMGERPVRVRWRKRRWRCRQDECGVRLVHGAEPGRRGAEQSSDGSRGDVGDGADAARERVGAGQRPAVAGRMAHRLVASRSRTRAARAGPVRFDGVEVLGVDEHLWHHVSTKPAGEGGRGPKELTGMVDLTRDATGRVRARLLDLVPGAGPRRHTQTGSRSGTRRSAPG